MFESLILFAFYCALFLLLRFICAAIFTLFYLVLFFLCCLVLFGSMVGIIIERNLLIKFYLSYEIFFFTISVILLFCAWNINSIILVLFFLVTTTFEVVLGSTVPFICFDSLLLLNFNFIFTS